MSSEAVKTVSVEVCHGPQCSDSGGRALAAELQACGMQVRAGDCRNQCPHAPVVLIDESMVCKATSQKVQQLVADKAGRD